MLLSLYPEFSAQVQEARRKFIDGKKQLQAMQLEYRMLYPEKLRVDVSGIPIFFTDPKKLEQFVKRRKVGGDNDSAADEEL
ncbi:hypothetical protein NDU88_003846 [Pleurodeles waltl]|uniref:Uncharacterized protein n=1 Tax=Pleurodeles waltl TaxID=8319 RepID=A0AAV7N1B2_PLEWA|nr:hypothetical protein NDU88_003846 [Pleurodeles waltl]